MKQKEINKAVNEVKKAWEGKKEELKDEVKEELQNVLQGGYEAQQQGNPHSEELQAKVRAALEEEKDKDLGQGTSYCYGFLNLTQTNWLWGKLRTSKM